MERLEQLRGQVRAALLGLDGIQAVVDGKADPAFYRRYLENVWHYAQHSSVVIGLAGSRCVNSHPALAQYLLHHALEELGHDEWALEDLAALGADVAAARASRPVPACAAMIGFEYFTAGHANPAGLFGWLYILEAMGDDLGHLVAEKVAAGLSLPDGVRFLAGHGDADEDHTREIIEQIKTNMPAADMPDVIHVAEVVADLYVRMFQEIGDGK
jgi:heme oxygenase